MRKKIYMNVSSGLGARCMPKQRESIFKRKV